MLRCLIVDDDIMSLKSIEALARKSGCFDEIESCLDPLEATAILRKEDIDILFTDIEMPAMTGLDLIRSLKNPPEVILITGKQQYAVDAFEIQVADYLVKPVALPRFLKAVNRVRERLEVDKEVRRTPDTIFVREHSQLVSVRLADLQSVEATGDYVTLSTATNRYIVHTTMKGIEKKLPAADFIRVHRSYIVRIDKIKAIDEALIVIGKNLIPIGDSYRSALMKRINPV